MFLRGLTWIAVFALGSQPAAGDVPAPAEIEVSTAEVVKATADTSADTSADAAVEAAEVPTKQSGDTSDATHKSEAPIDMM